MVKVEKAPVEKPVVVASVVEPAPVKVEKAREPAPAAEEEERPFFGLPDDPGVKEGAEAKRDGTTGFRLF